MAPARSRGGAPPLLQAAERQSDPSSIATTILYAEQDWDSSPIKMPGWVARLEKDAPTANPAFDALVKFGYTTSRNSVACVTAAHAAALQDGTYGPYTYANPSFKDPATVREIMIKAAAGAAFKAAADAALAADPKATVLPVSSRYVEGPEAISVLDLELNQWILGRISNLTVRDDYAKRSDGSGRELFRVLQQELST